MSDYRRIYEAYLLSDHWQNLRLMALAKASCKCEACDSKKRLVGHHMIYREPLESCTVEDIVCLCVPCHDLLHAWLDENKKRPWMFDRTQTVAKIRILKTQPVKAIAPMAANWRDSLEPQQLTEYDALMARAPRSGPKQMHNWAINQLQKHFSIKLKHLKWTNKKKPRGPLPEKSAKPKLVMVPKDDSADRIAKLEEIVRTYAERIAHLEQQVHLLKFAA